MESEAVPGEFGFVGPLAIQCVTCDRVLELMDPEYDGFEGEIDGNTTMRGSGPREEWQCPDCTETNCHVITGFSFGIEPDEDMAGHEEDFFDGFELYGTCTACQRTSLVTYFECA